MRKTILSIIICVFLSVSINMPANARLIEGSFNLISSVKSIMKENEVSYYQVVAGDSLWKIARSYGVDVDTLIVSNALDQKTILRIGQTIKVPYNSEEVESLHIISRGETMWDIAKKYGVSVNDMRAVNSDKNPTNLKIGEKLTIPSKQNENQNIYRTASLDIKEPSRGNSLAKQKYDWPIRGTITSRYGWRSSGFHHGLDIANKVGTPIRAVASGKVSFAGYKGVYGLKVVIDHSDGKQTLYAHAQNVYVKTGDTVRSGDVIATVGTTGRTTGPHIHFEVKENGKHFDPLLYLR